MVDGTASRSRLINTRGQRKAGGRNAGLAQQKAACGGLALASVQSRGVSASICVRSEVERQVVRASKFSAQGDDHFVGRATKYSVGHSILSVCTWAG